MNIRGIISKIIKEKTIYNGLSDHYLSIHHLAVSDLNNKKNHIIRDITMAVWNELENIIESHPVVFFSIVEKYLGGEKIENFLATYFRSKKHVNFDFKEAIELFLRHNLDITHIKKGSYVLKTNTLSYKNCEFKGDYQLEIGNSFKYFKDSVKNIKNGSFDITCTKDVTFFEIHNSKNDNKLKFDEIKVNLRQAVGNFEIRNTNISNFTISNFYNKDVNFRLTNCTIGNLLILDSDLGNSAFNGVRIHKLTLENVAINECIFNGTSFKTYDLGNIDGRISDTRLKDNYRQLKHVMDKNGNHTEANKFFAKEMESYSMSLNANSKNLKSLIQELYSDNFAGEKARNIGEIITLKFSRNVNEFGNNWIRPLFLLFGIAIVAVIIEGLATITGININSNIAGDLLIFMMFIFYLFIDISYGLLSKPSKIIDSIFKHYLIFIFVVMFLFLISYIIIPGFDSVRAFSYYINPIGLLPDYKIISGERFYIHYNGIELLAFVLYKLMYGIILWHLIVAAKRTTKR